MLSLLSDLQFHRACSLAGGGICFILRLLSWLLTRLTDCSRSRSMPVPPSICRRLLRSSASRFLLHFLVCSSVVCFTFATASASLYTRICFTFATASASLSRLLFSHLLHFCHNVCFALHTRLLHFCHSVCFTFATASASLLPQRLSASLLPQRLSASLLPQRLLHFCHSVCFALAPASASPFATTSATLLLLSICSFVSVCFTSCLYYIYLCPHSKHSW